MIAQENTQYTADEIKAMVKTCEKYKNALDKAKKLYKKYCINNVLEDLFPELKESKDEGIRKTIYGWIYTQPSEFFDDGFSKEEMLDWVEKQGQRESTWNKEDEENMNNILYILHQLKDTSSYEEDNIAEKTINWFKSLKDRLCSNNEYDKDMLGAIEYCKKNNRPLEKEHLAWLEKQGKAYRINNTPNCGISVNIYNEELKESEDEKIRKTLIEYIKGIKSWNYFLGISKEQMIAWLEKQGNKSVNIDVESMVSSYEQRLESQDGTKYAPLVNMCLTAFRHGVENVLEELNLNKLEKQGKKKSTDKAEPKFKVGDWIIENDCCVREIIQITDYDSVKSMYSCTDEYGNKLKLSRIDEDEYHLWTIQDAKDGDVLYAKGSYFKEYVFKFSSFTEDNVISTHFGYDVFHGTFDTKLSRFGREEDFVFVNPATKEQCNLLLSKMKEAGCEWDSEKKELKKIEVTSKENKDERMMEQLCDFLRDNMLYQDAQEITSWLEKLLEKQKD